MSAGTLTLLLLCNVMWSITYSVSKAMMSHGFEPLEIGFLRFFVGAVLLTAYTLKGKQSRRELKAWFGDFRLVDLRIVGVGLLTFFVSPLCQMKGLQLSRAVDGALIIAIEPLVSILAACLFLGERLKRTQTFGIALALIGTSVLTELTWTKLASFADARLVGNLIFMTSLFSEAAYSVLGKPALDRRSPLLFVTASIWVGVLALGIYNLAAFGPSRLAGIAPLVAHGAASDWLTVFFLGAGCTAFGYVYWMHSLKRLPVSLIALTLYIQPVLGMMWGSVWLGESLNASTYSGAALILGAVWIASRQPKRKATAQAVA